jgi:hypothetical protein
VDAVEDSDDATEAPASDPAEDSGDAAEQDAEQEPEDSDADDHDAGPLDQLGIPMSREPTIDDVRGDGDAHRRLAFGCSAIVLLALIGFWLVRAVLLG